MPIYLNSRKILPEQAPASEHVTTAKAGRYLLVYTEGSREAGQRGSPRDDRAYAQLRISLLSFHWEAYCQCYASERAFTKGRFHEILNLKGGTIPLIMTSSFFLFSLSPLVLHRFICHSRIL
jgi:hypothetical protein